MELIDIFTNFFKDILKPYKYKTVEEVESSDIENQIEKYSKLSVVGASNILVNICILKIDVIKYICENIKREYDVYMQHATDVNVSEIPVPLDKSVNDESPKEESEFESVEKPIELKKEE